MIKINEQGPKLSESQIAFIEKKWGKKFPDVYWKFLLENNGGLPSPDVIDVQGLKESPTDVQVFFGIGRKFDSSNLFWNLDLVLERFAGEHLFPIACDSYGNIFCLNEDDEIVFCEMNDPDKIHYKVAPDFEKFLEKIRP